MREKNTNMKRPKEKERITKTENIEEEKKESD